MYIVPIGFFDRSCQTNQLQQSINQSITSNQPTDQPIRISNRVFVQVLVPSCQIWLFIKTKGAKRVME